MRKHLQELKGLLTTQTPVFCTSDQLSLHPSDSPPGSCIRSVIGAVRPSRQRVGRPRWGLCSRIVCIPAQISALVPRGEEDVRAPGPTHSPSQSSTCREEASRYLGKEAPREECFQLLTFQKVSVILVWSKSSSLFMVTRNRDNDLNYNLLAG